MNKQTIVDIANLSGFSRATVSRVINGDINVKDSTRLAIENLITEVGYKPSTIARGLAKGHVDIFALILGDVRNPFFSDITYWVQNIMQERGYMVALFNSDFDADIEVSHMKALSDMNIAGIMLISSIVEKKHLLQLEKINIPIVTLHRQLRGIKSDSVMQDNFQASYMLTKHFIGLGHKRIAFLMGPSNSTSSIKRFEGYKQALLDGDITFDPSVVYKGDFKLETGFNIGLDYLVHLDRMPRGMICGNDYMAIGFLDACRLKGIKVPEEISIAGFDDIEIASLNSIQLTTVHHDIYEMCKSACDIMIDRVKNPTIAFKNIVYNPKLVIRNTTSNPPI